mgnify:CR=1 FL=1
MNRHEGGGDEGDGGWSGTLRSEGRQLKPWEREAMVNKKYQSATATTPYRPHAQQPHAPQSHAPQPHAPQPAPQPMVSPKPKVQISTPAPMSPRAPAPVENYAPPAGYNRSVSPAVPPKPMRSPTAPLPNFASYQPKVCSTNDAVSGQNSGKNLQYNSPIGLYSRDSIRDTYKGQTQTNSSS